MTNQNASSTVDDLKHKAQDTADELKQRAQGTADDLRSTANDRVHDARDRASNAWGSVREIQPEDLSNKAHEVIDKAKSMPDKNFRYAAFGSLGLALLMFLTGHRRMSFGLGAAGLGALAYLKKRHSNLMPA